MKFLFLFVISLGFVQAHAAPLVGIATQLPANEYRIFNSKGEVIYTNQQDTLKRVELRDGLAVVQLISDSVSLIREDGAVLLDTVFGSEIGISRNLLSVYNKNGNGFVFTLDGKQIYPSDSTVRNQQIDRIWIGNDRFAIADRWTQTFTVYSVDGRELYRDRMITQAKLSDGFVAIFSALGAFTLYDSEMNILVTAPTATDVKLSDQFAGFVDQNGVLRLFSRERGEFPMIQMFKSYQLTNHFVMVDEPFGLNFYGKDQRIIETVLNPRGVSLSHEWIAYRNNTGALTVLNSTSGQILTLNQADSFSMSDDLLLVKNGNSEFRVYSLFDENFGKAVLSFLDPVITQFSIGNGIVSFERRLPVAPGNTAQIHLVNPVYIQGSSPLSIDENRISRVELSVNREEWNWQ